MGYTRSQVARIDHALAIRLNVSVYLLVTAECLITDIAHARLIGTARRPVFG
jgi:hypothetical protein